MQPYNCQDAVRAGVKFYKMNVVDIEGVDWLTGYMARHGDERRFSVPIHAGYWLAMDQAIVQYDSGEEYTEV